MPTSATTATKLSWEAPKVLMTKQLWSFSKLQKLKNGLISASFITNPVTNRPVNYAVHEIRTPLGISEFGGSRSILFNLDEDNPQHSELISNLSILASEAQAKYPNIQIKSPVTFEKYKWQLKIKVTNDTEFLEADGETVIEDIDPGKFKNCFVDILFKPTMIWVRGQEGGISLKLEALQRILPEEYPQKPSRRPPRLMRSPAVNNE
jgi:hypothetical protein